MTQVVEKAAVQVGDIFYSSWGYDQTNIDFYKIVKATNKTVWIQEIEKEYIEQTDWAHYYVKPFNQTKIYSKNVYNNDGELVGMKEVEAPILMKRIGDSYGEKYIKISSFEYARPWDKEKVMETHTC